MTEVSWLLCLSRAHLVVWLDLFIFFFPSTVTDWDKSSSTRLRTGVKLKPCRVKLPLCFSPSTFSLIHLSFRLTDRGAQNSFPTFFLFSSLSPNNPFQFLSPRSLYTKKSTRTQLKIHFVWPKSEGVCAMGLLHSALKLVLWRRMGYYYLPATHPAIKTSGATSPQRSAAALPPFLSLSRSSYTSHTRQWARLLTPRRRLCCTDTSKNHTLLSSAAFFSLRPLDIPPWVFLFLFSFFFPLSLLFFLWMAIRGQWRGACEWTDCLADWLTDWPRERQLCFKFEEKIKKRRSDADRSSEERRSLSLVWKYKDTWGGIRKLNLNGRWWAAGSCGMRGERIKTCANLFRGQSFGACTWVCVCIRDNSSECTCMPASSYLCLLFWRAHTRRPASIFTVLTRACHTGIVKVWRGENRSIKWLNDSRHHLSRSVNIVL